LPDRLELDFFGELFNVLLPDSSLSLLSDFSGFLAVELEDWEAVADIPYKHRSIVISSN